MVSEGVTIGKPVQAKEVANHLADLSALSLGDYYSMLGNPGKVLGEFMNSEHIVKLYGVGTFYYTPDTQGQGVDTAEEVSAKQIVCTRVRFIPETTHSVYNQITPRSLVSGNTFWEELKLDSTASSSGGNDDEDDGKAHLTDNKPKTFSSLVQGIFRGKSCEITAVRLRVVQQQFGVAADGGQRGAQFVGDILDEVAPQLD